MKKQPKTQIYLCSECGKPVTGDHVYIQTRRGTKLHIHYECMNRGGRK